MFGYVANEDIEINAYPIILAHKLAFQLTKVRKNGTLPYIRLDDKTQVSSEYDENYNTIRLEAIMLSTQHDENVSQEEIHKDINKNVFEKILPINMLDDNTKFFINSTGRVVGGV